MVLIRHASLTDLQPVSEMEALCFPASEAATQEQLKERIATYGNHFWLLERDGKLLSFADGLVSDQPVLTDSMYSHARMHNEVGSWQMIFGVNTHPDFRRQGWATRVLRKAIEEALQQRRKGLFLTCKEEKIPFYESLGFLNEGPSDSEHGHARWYNMRLTFDSGCYVCKADPGDLEDIVEFMHMSGEPDGSGRAEKQMQERLSSKESAVFLAKSDNGSVAGYAYCFRMGRSGKTPDSGAPFLKGVRVGASVPCRNHTEKQLIAACDRWISRKS